MKSVILSFLAACVYVAWGQILTTPTPQSCAILDTNWNLWDVSTNYYNSSDSGGPMSANLCLDMEKSCAHSTNEPCSVCQFRDQNTPTAHSYCIGYSKNEVYSPLNATQYPGYTGFHATLTGDSDYCPGGQARITNIDVLCNQLTDEINFKSESPICTYNFVLSQSSTCSVSAASFTPTFTVTSITPNAITIVIDDGYPYEFWNYNVKVNGNNGYRGSRRDVIIENLDPGTTYNIIVERDSGDGAILSVLSPSVTLSVTTLPNNLGNSLTSSPSVSGTGTGFLLGVVIAGAVAGLVFGVLKLRQTDWWADKFGGSSGGRSSKGFSLMDAEKSNAFE